MSVKSATCFVLISLPILINTLSGHSARKTVLSASCSLLVLALTATSLFTYFSPALTALGWEGIRVMSADSAILFSFLGIATLLFSGRKQAFNWELGSTSTTGFVIIIALLVLIGLSTTRAQQQVTQVNLQLAHSEALYARAAGAFSHIAHLQNSVLNYLLSGKIESLNEGLVVSDRIRLLLDEMTEEYAANPEEMAFYKPFEALTLNLLDWATKTLATRHTDRPEEQWKREAESGNRNMAELIQTMNQLENDHRHYVSHLKQRSELVMRTSFVIAAFGTMSSVALFFWIMLRINRLMIERQQAQDELSQREQQYRTLADSGQALIWTAGTDKLCNYFNKVWLDFTGRPLESELGNGWAEGVHPDDFEFCLNYCLDITDRKRINEALRESEWRFRNLLGEMTSVAVQGCTPDLRIVYWNKASEILLGYTSEEALGKLLTDLIILPENIKAVKSDVARILAKGPSLTSKELSLLRKDGSRVEVISSLAFVETPGKTGQLYFIRVDITQRKQIEQELETYREHLEDLVGIRTQELAQAKEAAESANRAKSTFLANMSHEIRTPMNAIIGFTHLLRREVGNEKSVTKLDKINAAAQHLLSILNDILDLSKIEANRFVLEEKEFSPAAAIDDTLTMFRDKAHAKGLRLTCRIAENIPASLLGDSLRFSQILLNLVGNAIKFTEHGEISITLQLLEETPDTVTLRLDVRDQGIGIDKEHQERIFKPFVQADDSTTRKYGGSGLGLSICRHIAEAMGGQIGVDSQLGQGSCFWVTISLRKAIRTGAPTSQSAATSPLLLPEDVIRERFGGMRILLAEDDFICSEVAAELLQLAGLEVDIVANGQEAVDHARESNYAIVLMDMQMPVMNGLEATRAIRALPGKECHPYILAMTANAFEEDRQACLDSGINSHLGKPVNPDDLYATLSFWLEKSPAQPARSTPGAISSD